MNKFKPGQKVTYKRGSYGSIEQNATVIDYQYDGKVRIAVGRGAKPPSIEYVKEDTLKVRK